MPLFDFMGSSFWNVAVFAAFGGLMRGFAGFGAGMLMVPVLSIVYGPVHAVTLVVLLEAVATVQLIPEMRKKIDWKFVGLMAFFAALCMPIGGWLLVSLSPETLTRIISSIVLGSVALLASGWKFSGQRSKFSTAGIGALSGVKMGATSLGMPPVMLYLLSGKDDTSDSRRNAIAYFALTLIAMLFVMMIGGLLNKEVTLIAAVLAPLFIGATWLGSRFYHRSGAPLYRPVALSLLAFAGLYGLLH